MDDQHMLNTIEEVTGPGWRRRRRSEPEPTRAASALYEPISTDQVGLKIWRI